MRPLAVPFRPPLPRDRCGFHPVRIAGERVGVRGHIARSNPLTPALSPTAESSPKALPIVGERGQTGQTTAHWRMHTG